MSERFLKIQKVAEMLDVSEWTVRKWLQNRKLRYYKFGKAVRVKESDVLSFAEVRPSSDELLMKVMDSD